MSLKCSTDGFGISSHMTSCEDLASWNTSLSSVSNVTVFFVVSMLIPRSESCASVTSVTARSSHAHSQHVSFA